MVLELMEGSMRTPLTPTSERKGRPEHAGRGHVGGSHRSSGWSTQDVCGKSCIA
jgi:hypothetical protein